MTAVADYRSVTVPQGGTVPNDVDAPEAVAVALERAKGGLVRTIYRLDDGDRWIVALGLHRPGTAQEKLTAWAGDPTLLAALADRVAEQVASWGAISLKLEVPSSAIDWLTAATEAGFASFRSPLSSGPATVDAASAPRGFVRRLGGWTAPELAYYRQTTDITCGPVASATAAHATGWAEELVRGEELQLWREATTFPGCGPYGLATGLASRGIPATVVVNTTAAMQLEETPAAWLAEMREYVNTEFRLQAEAAGVVLEHREFDVDEIFARVAAGQVVVLLIDQLLMHAEACAHWVTVHAAHGDVALVEDPWTDHDLGESWVDAHELAVTRDALATMASWGTPVYQSMLVLEPAPTS